MREAKVLEVIRLYRQYFEKMEVEKIDFPHEKIPLSQQEKLAHCYAKLDQMEEFVAEGRMEKTFRWIGFIQGVLWSEGIYVLDDLKDHNRPDSS